MRYDESHCYKMFCIKPALSRRCFLDCSEFRTNLSCPEYSSMLFEPEVFKIICFIFCFKILTLNIPCAGMSILHIGDTDGSVTDSVVHHRVHTHSHAVLGQHLTCSWHNRRDLYLILPLEEEHPVLLSLNPLSDMTQYRVGRKIFL